MASRSTAWDAWRSDGAADEARARAMLASADRGELELPESLDPDSAGRTFLRRVRMPSLCVRCLPAWWFFSC